MLHPFHLVTQSPWPALLCVNFIFFGINFISWLKGFNENLLISLINGIFIVSLWFRDILREALEGSHTLKVQAGIKKGFFLFVFTEVMLFISFFWSFFNSSLGLSILGNWPLVGIEKIDVLGIPLLGSLLLLSSGFFQTESEYYYSLGNKYKVINLFIIGLVLGSLFIIAQGIEYYYSTFTLSDAVVGSVFYFTTGLHGLHVIAGVIFLTIAFVRIITSSTTIEHKLSFILSLTYWHVVDLIWLFVYISYYWFAFEIL